MLEPFTQAIYDTIIEYDTSVHISKLDSRIGSLGDQIIFDFDNADTLEEEFTDNELVATTFDLLSYPIRANVAIIDNNYYGNTECYKAKGSGTMIAPNVVLTAAHIVGHEVEHLYNGKYFEWNDSLYVAPSLQDSLPQPDIGKIEVSKCYIFKRFYNKSGELFTPANDDIALLILEEPIGYQIGWIGLNYVPDEAFLKENLFYQFGYPGINDDGFNMYYKYGQFRWVSDDLKTASNSQVGISGESGSAFFINARDQYTAYGIRTTNIGYTLVNEDKFHVFAKIIEANAPDSVSEIDLPQEEIQVYPNPASERVLISGLNDTVNSEITVYNSIGKICVFKKGFFDEVILNISGLPEGVYAIKIVTDKSMIVKKLFHVNTNK